MGLRIEHLRQMDDSDRRRFAKARPDTATIKLMLGVRERTPDRELHMRADFYQLPPIAQTRSLKRFDGARDADCQLEREHCHERIEDPRQRAILKAARVGIRIDAVQMVLADLIAEESRRRELLDEAENTRDVALSQSDRPASINASIEYNLAAARCWTVGRSKREHASDLRQYACVADAVVREIVAGIGDSDRTRAAACDVERTAYRRHFKAPYEWALEEWRQVLRAGMCEERPDY